MRLNRPTLAGSPSTMLLEQQLFGIEVMAMQVVIHHDDTLGGIEDVAADVTVDQSIVQGFHDFRRPVDTAEHD